MYKIGEFSKITNVTVKTLHYYDDEGILKASRYLDNGYRMYSEEDYEKAQRIILLRTLDFSIREIKDVIANVDTDEDLQYFLKEKQQMIQDKIKNQKELLKKIETYLSPNINKGEKIMQYEMLVKEIEATEVATIRFVGHYATMGLYLSKIYKYLKSNTNGQPFVCYHDGEYKEEADIEVCVPIKKHIVGTDEITIKVLPSIKALTTIHVGRYEELSKAYKAILDYANNEQIEIEYPSREKYIKGPGMVLKGNPDKYMTEIIIPIKE